MEGQQEEQTQQTATQQVEQQSGEKKEERVDELDVMGGLFLRGITGIVGKIKQLIAGNRTA